MRAFTIPLLFSSLLGLGLLALAEPTLSPYTLHERRSSAPVGWARHRKHNASKTIPLRFALSQSNLDAIDDILFDISHPESPNYGNHWTSDQVAEKFAPSKESVETVRSWLLSSGFSHDRIRLSSSGGWIEVDSTIAEAEELLRADYHVYKHESGHEQTACEEYHLPAHVAPHVDMVTPTVHFTSVKRGVERPGTTIMPGAPGQGIHPHPLPLTQPEANAADLSKCNTQITPACLKALYGINYTPVAASKNSYGIVEYTPQAYLAKDMDLFMQKFDPSQVGKRPILNSIDGGVVQTTTQDFNHNGESDLDLQYGMALVGNKQPITLYQVGDTVEGASFNDFLDAIDGSYCKADGGDDPIQDAKYPDPAPGGYKGKKDCGKYKPTNVISTSYGYNEADLTAKYTARQCKEYAKLGMMGVTVLYSSGDYGVAGNGGNCLNPDGSQSTSGKRFNPSFPASCPYITAVGATQIDPGKKVTDPEGACQQVIYSGGGFSNRFALPDYQKTVVGSYFKNHKPTYSSSVYNSTQHSRGFPDLSANGANYVVNVNGQFSLIYGTSASAPVVGAMLTLINDARISKGKKPIGFINPTIYQSSFQGAFHDITHGGNQGCGTKGFTAVAGWDPVTGLGTPNFPEMMKKFLALP